MKQVDVLARETEHNFLEFSKAFNSLSSDVQEVKEDVRAVIMSFKKDILSHDVREVRALNNFVERLDAIRRAQSEINYKLNQIVPCEKCGCLIEKVKENRGQSTIDIDESGRESIARHYFCKTHMPKGK